MLGNSFLDIDRGANHVHIPGSGGLGIPCLMPVASGRVEPGGPRLGESKLEGLNVQTLRSVGGQVTTAEGDPVRDANVTITTNAGTKFTSVSTDELGNFRADFML